MNVGHKETACIQNKYFITLSIRRFSLMSRSKYQSSPTVFQKPNGRRVVTTCAICSAVAIYAYCGAVVCPACKIFFKRNVRNELVKYQMMFSIENDFNGLTIAEMSI